MPTGLHHGAEYGALALLEKLTLGIGKHFNGGRAFAEASFAANEPRHWLAPSD